MKFVINDKQKMLNDDAVRRTESRAFAAFAKYGDEVKSVVVTVADANGPRGGIDKACKVRVRLRGQKDVIVNATDISLSKAISATIDRASRSVRRNLARRFSRMTPRLQFESQ